MVGSILAETIAYGAQQAGQWLKSPEGKAFIKQSTLVFREIDKKLWFGK